MNYELKKIKVVLINQLQNISIMGLYDTFLVKEAKCTLCGHYFKSEKCNIDFQSKDFECLLDRISEGEDVRRSKPQYWLRRSNLGFSKDSKFYISVERAKKLARNKKKYKIWISKDGKSVCLYKYVGERTVNFARETAIFKMYTTCPKCKELFDGTGVILDHVFIGQLEAKNKKLKLVLNDE